MDDLENPIAKLRLLFKAALGESNPDSEKLAQEFQYTLDLVLNTCFAKIQAFKQAVSQQNETIKTHNRFVWLQDATVQEQHKVIAQKRLDIEYLITRIAEKDALIQLLTNDNTQQKKELQRLHSLLINEIPTRPIEWLEDVLIQKLTAEESEEVNQLKLENALAHEHGKRHLELSGQVLNYATMQTEIRSAARDEIINDTFQMLDDSLVLHSKQSETIKTVSGELTEHKMRPSRGGKKAHEETNTLKEQAKSLWDNGLQKECKNNQSEGARRIVKRPEFKGKIKEATIKRCLSKKKVVVC